MEFIETNGNPLEEIAHQERDAIDRLQAELAAATTRAVEAERERDALRHRLGEAGEAFGQAVYALDHAIEERDTALAVTVALVEQATAERGCFMDCRLCGGSWYPADHAGGGHPAVAMYGREGCAVAAAAKLLVAQRSRASTPGTGERR